MREACIAHLQVAPVVARGGHGQFLQFDNPVHRAATSLWAFEGHSPGYTAGLAAHGAQLAIQRCQCMPHAVLMQHMGHAVHRVSLRNSTQVDLHGGMLAGTA